MKKINLINNGIASRIGDKIYLNKALKDYPELFSAILTHEIEHTNGFTWKDVKMDLVGSHLQKVKPQYYKFILTHPSSWTMFLPFGIYEKKIVFDPMIAGLWLITISIGGIIWSFL